MPVTNEMIAKWRTEKSLEEWGEVAVKAKDIVPGDIVITGDNHESRYQVNRVTTDGFKVRIYVQYEDQRSGEIRGPELCLSHWPNQFILVEY